MEEFKDLTDVQAICVTVIIVAAIAGLVMFYKYLFENN